MATLKKWTGITWWEAWQGPIMIVGAIVLSIYADRTVRYIFPSQCMVKEGNSWLPATYWQQRKMYGDDK